jgi:hypothetical protein
MEGGYGYQRRYLVDQYFEEFEKYNTEEHPGGTAHAAYGQHSKIPYRVANLELLRGNP